MLSHLKLGSHFRSLTEQTFSGDVRFGRRTILYGHNGSGKSSLAELLHQIGAAQHSIQVTWFDETNSRLKLPPQSPVPEVVISSFCKSWTKENVSDFLDGESAAAIVSLGKEATDAKKQEDLLRSQIDQLESDEPIARTELESAKEAATNVARATQDSIEGTLRDVDHRTYTKHVFNLAKVRQLLSKADGEVPSEDDHRNNLDALHRGPLKATNMPPYPSPDWKRLFTDTQALLARGVQSEVINEILGNQPLQKWLEEGLAIHEDESSCHFCKHALSRERITELQRHFDDSRKQVQAQVKSLRDEIVNYKDAVSRWQQSFPDASDLYPELAEELATALENESGTLDVVRDKFEKLDGVLSQKFDSPERTDLEIDSEVPKDAGAYIKEVCKRHDGLASSADKRRQQTAKKVLAYIIGKQANSYRKLIKDEEDKKSAFDAIVAELKAKKRLIKEARSKQFSSKEMADRISHDLAVVYGRHYLSIEISPDGKNYRCLREGSTAKHLSEGERNTLALIYFLRHLEDEAQNIEPANRLVIIDDPSSSLDREAVFATHSWLLKSLERYGQTIILTHDFEMLRLFLNSQKSQLSKHRSTLKQGSKTNARPEEKAKKEAEETYPRISFLEIRTSNTPSGSRQSRLTALSSALLDFRSEYHFLFDRLLKGIEEPEDHELIFLLPNAARRILETFSAFHVPGRSHFEQQLRKIALEDCNEEFRDVYDFCNRFSHGEGREVQLVLDATTVSRQIVRCLELLKSTSPLHYEGMCKAVGRNQVDPLTHRSWPSTDAHQISKAGPVG